MRAGGANNCAERKEYHFFVCRIGQQEISRKRSTKKCASGWTWGGDKILLATLDLAGFDLSDSNPDVKNRQEREKVPVEAKRKSMAATLLKVDFASARFVRLIR
jgi:hypothetical protein